MNSKEVVSPLLTSRIVWAALSFSLLFYGFILFEMGKASFVSIPETLSMLEIMALGMGLTLIVTLWIHENKVKPERDMNKRFPFYVICWALNEAMVVFAFAAIIGSKNGNGFVYVTNFILALVGNLIMFPVKHFDGADRTFTQR